MAMAMAMDPDRGGDLMRGGDHDCDRDLLLQRQRWKDGSGAVEREERENTVESKKNDVQREDLHVITIVIVIIRNRDRDRKCDHNRDRDRDIDSGGLPLHNLSIPDLRQLLRIMQMIMQWVERERKNREQREG